MRSKGSLLDQTRIMMISVSFLFFRNDNVDIISLYVRRFIRLTPSLAVAVLFSMSLLRFFGNGPFWTALLQFYTGHCHRYWWSTLSYSQNLVNPNEICNINAWHVCVDMQLFIITPAIVYLIHRFKVKTIIALVAVIMACAWYTIHLHVKYNLSILYVVDTVMALPSTE